MTSQTSYWNRLIQPGIVALVGAGGKTTVLSKLVEYGRLKGQPIVVTNTTRLYESQVDSLDCDLIDGLAKLHPNWQIVVEADGAKEKWLKAPKTTEPVIPSLTKTTIGLVNLQMLGAPLDDEHVHNIELVQDIVKRDMGAIVTPRMLADLVLHKQGLFQYSKGKKILFCTGYETVQHRIIDDFIDHIVDSDISDIILADGYKASCEIRRIIQCR